MAVGRRLPGWPECHTPDWADKLPLDQQKIKLLSYIETVVNRYKKSPAIRYWQVENEAFLAFFSGALCGRYSGGLDDFLKEEISLVRKTLISPIDIRNKTIDGNRAFCRTMVASADS